MDYEALWKIPRQRDLPDQQAVQVEEVVEGEQDGVQSKPGQGDLRHFQVIVVQSSIKCSHATTAW